jgi:transcriptional regulator with XRE-family HTH domain
MPAQKLYAGVKLRETRTRIGLTQKDFAEKLGVSLPYLNQMENNNRPVSTGVVLALAQEFGLDVTELGSTGDTERLVTDMREALADPVFADTAPPVADLRLVASNAPALARAFLDLHRAYRQTHERLASLDEALGRIAAARCTLSPWEEVRDFFHYCDNYIDAVDRAAEHFAGPARGGSSYRIRARRARVTLRRRPGRASAITTARRHADALPPRRPRPAALPAPAPIRAPGAGPASGGHARPRPVPVRRPRARSRASAWRTTSPARF